MLAESGLFSDNPDMRELDQAIIRIAIENARKHLSEGSSPVEAAKLATSGAWAEYRFRVLDALHGKALHPPNRPPPAPVRARRK